jgi:hypothetical protein
MKRQRHHAPIPTTYNGVTYRSRLEAKWQVFFDELEFEASYEAEPVYGPDGDILYVPDFLIYSGIKCTDWTTKHYIEIKPLPPNKEYISYLQSLPIPIEIDILVCVGLPDFRQPTGTWLMDIGPPQGKVLQNGFLLKQCPFCSQYRPMAINRQDEECECFFRFGKEKDAKKVSHNFRFDL